MNNDPNQRHADDDNVHVLINQLRSEFLDSRSRTIDRWLAATAGFLSLLAILSVVLGFVYFERVRALARDAETAIDQAKEARTIVDEITIELSELMAQEKARQEANAADEDEVIRTRDDHAQ